MQLGSTCLKMGVNFFFQIRFYYVALLVVWTFKSVIKSVVGLVAEVGRMAAGEAGRKPFIQKKMKTFA